MARQHNILFITPWFPHQENPIEGIFIKNHAKAVTLRDRVVVLHLIGARKDIPFFGHLEKIPTSDHNDEIPIYQLTWKLVPLPNLTYLLYLISVIRAVRRIIADGFKPDILHAHVYTAGVSTIVISRLFHIPALITEHSSAFIRNLLPQREILKARSAFKRAQYVLPVSMALQKAIQSYGIQANFQIVSNSVDPDLFYPLSKTDKSKLKHILFVGSLLPIKGIPTLIRALHLVIRQRDDWRLEIVGEGPLRPELERLASVLGLENHVRFHGLISTSEVAEHMHRANFLILPSESETFSVVIAEALASGLPVITTRCGGPEELIDDTNGIFVPVGNVEALADAIQWMLDNLEYYSPMTIAKNAVARYGQDAVGKRLHSLYIDTLNLCDHA